MAVSTIKQTQTRLVVERKTLTFGACRNQTDYWKALDISKTGYNPIGVVGWETTGSYKTHFCISRLRIEGTDLIADIRSTNATSFTTDNTAVIVDVLYEKN